MPLSTGLGCLSGHTGSQEFSSVVPPQILGQVLRSAVHQDADQLVYQDSAAIEDEHVHLVPSSICSGSKPWGKEYFWADAAATRESRTVKGSIVSREE